MSLRTGTIWTDRSDDMAEPIRLSASGISSYDAKKAASAVDQAVNYLQQVKLDIDFKDSFSGMSMFPNTQGEL